MSETVWLRKEQGGCSIGPHTWELDGDVVEVPRDVASELLAIEGAGFSIITDPAAVPEPAGTGGDGEPPAPKPRRSRAAGKSAGDGTPGGTGGE